MPKIKEGDKFASLQEFKDSLRRWAIEENWTPHILDSDSHRVRAGCRSAPNCPFRIRANQNANRGFVLVTTCDPEHTCFETRDHDNPLHQDIKRSETGKLKFLLEAVPRLLDVTLETHVQEIVDAIEKKYGQKIPVRQAQKVKNALQPRVLGPCRHCRQAGHTRRHCPQLRHGTNTGELDFTIEDTAANSGDDQASDNGTYADGGLENAFDETPALLANANESQVAVTQPEPQQEDLQSQSNDFDVAPNLHSAIFVTDAVSQDFSSGVAQIDPQASQTNAQQVRDPVQTRLEASKLMQQAAKLMEQAAKLNSEAAQLNASVAHL